VAGQALVVVVPARNEEARLPLCLASLAAQSRVELRVLVSDNASSDATATVARAATAELDLVLRTVDPLGPSAHFVSAMRWALGSSDAEVFALLAGDDTWQPGFAAAALEVLVRSPEVDVVFPRFVWEGGGVERTLPAAAFRQASAAARQRAALLMPDRRELSNLVYGVYRRAAFIDLADAWAAGGDEFGADFAAAWAVLGGHRVAACDAAVGRRFTRAGADLLERIGFSRAAATGPVSMMTTYVRVNLAVNRALALAMRRVSAHPGQPRTVAVQLMRAPQWLWGALDQVRTVLRRSGQTG
jgi:glycosyltransferase involved in cell wall biosynthesis